MTRRDQPLSIGWFSTGRGPGSRALLGAVHEEISSGRLNAEIAVVFCNRGREEDPNTDLFLEQGNRYGLPVITLSSRDFRRSRGEKAVRKGEPLPDWRREYDREVMRLLKPYSFEVGVLAGYMLIFGEEAAARWNLLNLHPAEPGGPKGIWQDVIWELIGARADRAGVMVHLATPELDEGPPVTFCTYPIRGPAFDSFWKDIEGRTVSEIKNTEGEDNPLFKEIRRRGAARELPLMIETLRAVVERRIAVDGGRVIDSSGPPRAPLDLSEEVERVAALSADSAPHV